MARPKKYKERKAILLKIEKQDYKMLSSYARKHNYTITEFINNIIRQWMK